MDSYRDHPSDFEPAHASGDASPDDVAAAIGSDERRMHVRAYNYWVSLLDGRDFPSIEDLEPGEVEDFAPNSVLLDFTSGPANPATPYIGTAIREECGLEADIISISQVPSRSLLSRLTDHYLQIIANRAPIGFEAEFVNQRGDNICYRGILMPFSSDGDTIDFIYGVINWKHVGQAAADSAAALQPVAAQSVAATPEPSPEVEALGLEAPADEPGIAVPAAEPEPEDTPLYEVAAIAEPAEPAEPAERDPGIELPAAMHFSWEDGPLAQDADEAAIPEIALDEDAALADRLWAAREVAEVVKTSDGRTRAALYRALAMAYDFALASKRVPDEYEELLADSGVKAQARAPMTPIVKLVFGIDYDKTRLTEFASALSCAQRQSIDPGGFQQFIETQPGGLKALVAAERQARRGEQEAKPDIRGRKALATLRAAEPVSLESIAAQAEFALVVARRSAHGGYEPVALVGDESLLDRAIRKVGG